METQIFIGINLTQKLEQLYFSNSSNILSIEEHHNQKYLGFFIPSNMIAIDYLQKQKQILINYLELFFNKPNSLWSNLSFVIFPKSIIGNFHKYTPNPG